MFSTRLGGLRCHTCQLEPRSRLALAAAALAASQISLAAPAHALKLEGHKIENDGARQEIHVRFDRQADNWNAATDAEVSFRF